MKKTILILIIITAIQGVGQCQAILKDQINAKDNAAVNVCFELENHVKELLNGINQLEVDSVFKNISRSKFSGIISGGMLFTDFDRAYNITKSAYTNFKDMDLTILGMDCRVLSENSAFVITLYQETYINYQDKEISSKGTFTFIFEKIDGLWEIIHFHLSSFPINKD